jgi:glucose-6-phosphate dehydrogenase assembly protein OpcA
VSASPTERPGAVLDRVDAELRALWSTPPTSADGSDPTGTPARSPGKTRVRACTMNLVVVAATPALAAQWAPVVDKVLLGIPARAIVVGLDPGGDDGLEAQTSAVCIPGEDGGPQVCSERVTLFVRGAVTARLYSCVTAVSAADVPTTLVWVGGVRAGDPVFEALARDASRIVLDAAQGSLEGLARLVHSERLRAAAGSADGAGVADLAWTRLAPWQEMCARMFDEPHLRPLASRITRVVLAQASTAGAALGAEGLLLLGWLATRLGWKATAQPGKTALFYRGEEKIEVVLRANPSSRAIGGALLAAHIEATADGVTLNGRIVRDAGEEDAASWRLEVTAEGGEPQRLEQRVRLRATDKAALLERTLHRPLRDPALEQSVLWSDEWGGGELGHALP